MLGLREIRKGKVIVLEGEPYEVVSAQFSRKQQRRPVVRSMLKHVRTGQSKEHTFMQSDKVEEASIEHKPFQFLYRTNDVMTFMDQQTYEQIEIDVAAAGEVAQYLLEGQEAEVILFDGSPVTIELPIKIGRKVISAPPGVRGDTSTNVMKEVIVEGNVKVKAPLFIKEGDVIRIDTRSGEYMERA